MSLLELKYPARFAVEEFRKRKNPYFDTEGDAPPGAMETGTMDAGVRASMTDNKLMMARKNIDICVRNQGPQPNQCDFFLHWDGAVMQLSSIFKDVILYELMHYCCFFFEWQRNPVQLGSGKRQRPSDQVMMAPYQDLAKAVEEQVRSVSPILADRWKALRDGPPDFQAARNYVAHSGTLHGMDRLGASPDRTGFLGFGAADIIAQNLLQQAGFTMPEHTSPKYKVELLVKWHNERVQAMDEIRELALAHAPFFNPAVPKYRSTLSMIHKQRVSPKLSR